MCYLARFDGESPLVEVVARLLSATEDSVSNLANCPLGVRFSLLGIVWVVEFPWPSGLGRKTSELITCLPLLLGVAETCLLDIMTSFRFLALFVASKLGVVS